MAVACSIPAGEGGSALVETDLAIAGMSCAGCVAAVERRLRAVPGVARADVNLVTARAAVAFDPAPGRPRRADRGGAAGRLLRSGGARAGRGSEGDSGRE